MDLQKSRIIHGSKTFLGKIFGTARFKLHLSLLKKIILIKRISTKTGKIRRTRNSNRIF